MLRMRPARGTEFFERKLFRRRLAIFARRVILPLALIAGEAHQFPHVRLLLISRFS
jgi:hypothetical protein